MIRNYLAVLGTAAILFGAVACGGGDNATGPAPTPPTPPAPTTGTIRLLNESTATITAVYFTKCDEATWGSNRLAASERLAAGAMRTWTVEPGCYDLRASTGTKSASWYDRELAAGGAIQLAVPGAVASMIATDGGVIGLPVAAMR